MHIVLLSVSVLVAQGWVDNPSALTTVTLGKGQVPLVDESLLIELRGQHATTTLEQIFENKSGRRLEGVFELRTSPGTEVEGFCYWNGEQRIVGQVFEKMAARRIYESVRARRRDPGLLERLDEGLFRFRVFPIEPGERKRVQVRYARWLPSFNGELEYRAELADPNADITIEVSDLDGLPELTSPSHELRDRPSEPGVARVHGVPKDRGKQVILRFEARSSQWRLLAHAHKNGKENGFVNVLLAAPPSPAARRTGREITLLLDRSGSMAGEPLRKVKDAALEIIDALGSHDRINVGFFDDHADLLFAAPRELNQKAASRMRSHIERTVSGGGTNIAEALLAVFSAQQRSERPKFVLLLTDGRSDSRAILSAASKDKSEIRVFTVGLGDQVSKPVLSRLASLKRGRFVFIDRTEELQSQVLRLFERLAPPLWVDTEIEINGDPVLQAYPHLLPDLLPGDELRVSGRFNFHEDLHVKIRGRVAGQTKEIEQVIPRSEQKENEWVGRLWARSRVDELLEEEAAHGRDPERTNELIELAVAYNFVTPHTAFLAIPENEATGWARQSLVAIRAHKRKILERHRDALALTRIEDIEGPTGGARKAPAIQGKASSALSGLRGGGAFDLGGGVNFAPAGGGGGGGASPKNGQIRGTLKGTMSGYGELGNRGMGRKPPKAQHNSSLALALPTVMGALSKEVIQKVIRNNIRQIRYCYEVALQRQPNLDGKIVVKWVIGANGSVLRARIVSSTIKDKAVERCIMAKTRTWKFPAPAGGGTVEVNYPFVFQLALQP